jgi:glycosyltransferase involved in cell wall biosynthesis
MVGSPGGPGDPAGSGRRVDSVASMRILHAPTNPANQAGAVVAALRRLGHEAELWQYDRHPFGFRADRTIDTTSGDPAVFWRTFLAAIERFDVIHFHFGRSLFPADWGGVPPLWDLPMYRILGKRVFATWHGSDCRIRRIHLETNPWSHYRTSEIASDDDRTTKVIEVFRTYAQRNFVVSPDYLHFIPDATLMPRAIDLGEWPEQAPQQRDVPRLLHVPSRRGTKGTDRILAAIDRLRGEGLRFDFQLLEGVSHEAARQAIQAADVVIDNVITGDYEIVSLEAMASSRVAVANIQVDSARTFPDAPIFSVDPDSLDRRLRGLIDDVDLRRSLAARGRAYVGRRHDAAVIAGSLLEAYREPSVMVGRAAFPDWLSIESSRRIERLEAQLAAARVREMALQRRLGMPVKRVDDRMLKDRLPMRLRLWLRRSRARLARMRTR